MVSRQLVSDLWRLPTEEFDIQMSIKVFISVNMWKQIWLEIFWSVLLEMVHVKVDGDSGSLIGYVLPLTATSLKILVVNFDVKSWNLLKSMLK